MVLRALLWSLPVVAGVTAVACSPSMDAVGVSTAHGGTSGGAAADASAPRPLFDPAVRASLVAFGKGDETTGHAPGAYDFTLVGNDAARAAMDTGARTFPIGSVLGIDHQRRNEANQKGPSYFMEKRSSSGDRFGGWRFIATDSEGRVVDEGQLEACGYCHRDAPTDYVFPALSPVRAADGGAATAK